MTIYFRSVGMNFSNYNLVNSEIKKIKINQNEYGNHFH